MYSAPSFRGACSSVLRDDLNPGYLLESDVDGKIGISNYSITNFNDIYDSVFAQTANRAVITDATGKITTSPTTDVEVSYRRGQPSNVFNMFQTKQPNITGAATTITDDDLTIDKVLISSALGKVIVSNLDSGILTYLSNITSDVQHQINLKQNIRSDVAGSGL
jgi:hypothetical protein